MPKKYRIRDGFSFVDLDNKVLQGGATIELEGDVAALHAHKLEAVQDEPKKAKPAKSSADTDPLADPPADPGATAEQATPADANAAANPQ